MVRNHWNDQAHQEQERIIHGSIDLKDESGTMFVRLTQVAPFDADSRGPEWTTVNHEYWDFEQKTWLIDNPMISRIKDRNQLNVFETEEDGEKFFALLDEAITCYDLHSQAAGLDSTSIAPCKSVRTPI